MSELYARIARACGTPLLEEIWSSAAQKRGFRTPFRPCFGGFRMAFGRRPLGFGGANCHERFDASLENATRVFASVTHDSRELPRPKEPVPGTPSLEPSDKRVELEQL